ncbi:hypothetical protein D1AOALGA4SA_8096, partial [Olavius algarvensis Delta 1 endosymbiont]
ANFHLADSDMNLVHMADQVEVICRQLLVTRMLGGTHGKSTSALYDLT